MTDDDSQQGTRNRVANNKAARPKRAGDPNVLTGAAVPNQLADPAKKPAKVATGPRPGVLIAPAQSRPAPASPVPAGATPATPASRPAFPESDAPPEGRRLPALPTLIFLGFLALTAFRFVGGFLGGGAADPSAGPVATAVTPGVVRFGTGLDDDCNVTGAASTFTEFTEVLWAAEMATRQKASVTLLVIMRLDGEEIEREILPPDDSGLSWAVLCGEPIADGDPGTHRIEVWNEGETVLLAAGEFTVAPGSS